MKKNNEYLLVDGYNIVFAWEELKIIAETSLSDARSRLLEILSNYQGIKGIEILVVFDAHLQKGGLTHEVYHNIHVIYTPESQTADHFIERFTAKNAKQYKIKVATSDSLEQTIILGRGAERVSALGLLTEVKNAKETLKTDYLDKKPVKNNMLLDNLDPKTRELLEKMRLGNGR